MQKLNYFKSTVKLPKFFNYKTLKNITIPNIPLLQTSQKYPQKIAVKNDQNIEFTYENIFNQSLNIARELNLILKNASQNVKISTLLPPSENYITSLNAIWMLQHCFVPLHHTFPYSEIEYRI